MKRFLAGGLTAIALAFTGGASSAATVDFDSGSIVGGIYEQDGYFVEALNGGSIALPNDCGSRCLRLTNENSGHIYRLSRGGGAFTLNSFDFNGRDGEAPAVYATSTLVGSALGGSIELFNETNVSNIMSSTGLLSVFENVTAVYFQSAGRGSARIDNISVSAVPVPAAGFLLLAGLGGLGLMRRRRKN